MVKRNQRWLAISNGKLTEAWATRGLVCTVSKFWILALRTWANTFSLPTRELLTLGHWRHFSTRLVKTPWRHFSANKVNVTWTLCLLRCSSLPVPDWLPLSITVWFTSKALSKCFCSAWVCFFSTFYLLIQIKCAHFTPVTVFFTE